MGYIEQSLGQNESIIYRARFHRLNYIGAWISFSIIGVLAVHAIVFSSGTSKWTLLIVCIAALAGVLSWMIPVWTTEIAVTNHRLVVKRGWLMRATAELQLKSIEQVNFHQGPIGRLFDFGKIEVHGTGVDDVKLPNIACPTELVRAIEDASLPLRQPMPELSRRPAGE